MKCRLPAIDHRAKVRLWNKDWQKIAETRVLDGQRPVDVARCLLGEHDLTEGRVTVDWHGGYRWLGYVYIHHGETRYFDNSDYKNYLTWGTPT